MRTTSTVLTLLSAITLVVAVALGCGGGEGSEAHAQSAGARCAHCGMRVAADSTWRAGLTTRSGEALSFDAPKCMFRLLRGERGHGAREPWVIEYYSSERRPAAALLYVVGSDLASPMGRDLVPVEGRERAERLLRDHHGERILTFDEVTPAVIDPLFGGAHHGH